MIYPDDYINKIIYGDSLEILPDMPDNSVHACITDPPYALGFMGKAWDKFPSDTGAKKPFANQSRENKLGGIPYQNWSYLWAKEIFRILKPGGYLLSFGGSRTYHRMACAIEDAGFEIRDQIMWVYGSGFPKSLNIGKAIDKINGESGRLLKFVNWMRTTGLKQKEINEIIEKSDVGSHYLRKDQPAIPTCELWLKLRPHIKIEIPKWVDELVERIEAEREIIGTKNVMGKETNIIYGKYKGGKVDITLPATPEAKDWEGWGTALKPAHEPIVVARKPLSEKTVAENVLKWEVGGLNIDGCRIEGIKEGDPSRFLNTRGIASKNTYAQDRWTQEQSKGVMVNNSQGRFPANLIHDGSEEVLAEFEKAGTTKGNGKIIATKRKRFDGWREMEGRSDRPAQTKKIDNYGDNGTPARFFYSAKASKSERDWGCEEMEDLGKGMNFGGALAGNGKPINIGLRKNNHPTVKPIALMKYLVKLVTREGQIVIDPFVGSGSTPLACVDLNRQFIGIDNQEEYCKIARARIGAWSKESKQRLAQEVIEFSKV